MTAISKFSKYSPPVHSVTVEEWGGETVYLKGMDAKAMEVFFDLPGGEEGKYSAHRSALIITLHLCNEDGERLIADDERDEAAKELAGHQFSVISNLMGECMKVSGLAQDEIEEAAGN